MLEFGEIEIAGREEILRVRRNGQAWAAIVSRLAESDVWVRYVDRPGVWHGPFRTFKEAGVWLRGTPEDA